MPERTSRKAKGQGARVSRAAARPRPTTTSPERRIAEHPILTFTRGRELTFTFEGRQMKGYEGETIAAALAANGVRMLRLSERMNRPRGFFCAVGKCSSCLMVVDGRPNTMVCMEPLTQGARVERQVGRGRLP